MPESERPVRPCPRPDLEKIDGAALRTKKSIRGRVILAVILLYVIWLGWQIGHFKRYVSASRGAETASAGPEAFEIKGVYHIHSRFSDGRKTVDRIAAEAAAEGLDFIILTDHGKPNEASLDAQGRKRGVLVLSGCEISSNRGHLVALGFERPETGPLFSSEAETAAFEVAALGGFTVIAHPYSKTRWSWGRPAGYAGLEIIDADTMVRRNALRALPYLPALLLRPELTMLKIIDPPEQTLRKWDELLRGGPVLGFFSADAHYLYSAILPVFRLHVMLDQPPAEEFETARRQVFAALKQGRFFNAVDAAAEARGFRFRVQGPSLQLLAPFSFAHEAMIIRDGQVIHRTVENVISIPAPGPGVYRAEVYLRVKTPLDPGVPWIVSNPVIYGKEIP